jgi:uncharacterized membrane protein
MAELVAIGFDGPQEADRVLTELGRLEKEYLIDLEDAVVVIRQPDGRVQLKQSINLVGVGAATGGLSGAFWATLVGLLFLNPIAGFAVGGLAGAGALSGSAIDYGIDDDFIRSLAATLKPDTSALVALVRKAQPEQVLSVLSGFKGRVLRTSLSPEEARLQAALSGAAGQDTRKQPAVADSEPDRVEEADLEPFPASDPSAWMGTIGVRRHRSSTSLQNPAEIRLRGTSPRNAVRPWSVTIKRRSFDGTQSVDPVPLRRPSGR